MANRITLDNITLLCLYTVAIAALTAGEVLHTTNDTLHDYAVIGQKYSMLSNNYIKLFNSRESLQLKYDKLLAAHTACMISSDTNVNANVVVAKRK